MQKILELALSIASPFAGVVTAEPNCISIHSKECIYIENSEMQNFQELCSLAHDISIMCDTIYFWLEP